MKYILVIMLLLVAQKPLFSEVTELKVAGLGICRLVKTKQVTEERYEPGTKLGLPEGSVILTGGVTGTLKLLKDKAVIWEKTSSPISQALGKGLGRPLIELHTVSVIKDKIVVIYHDTVKLKVDILSKHVKDAGNATRAGRELKNKPEREVWQVKETVTLYRLMSGVFLKDFEIKDSGDRIEIQAVRQDNDGKYFFFVLNSK